MVKKHPPAAQHRSADEAVPAYQQAGKRRVDASVACRGLTRTIRNMASSASPSSARQPMSELPLRLKVLELG